MRSAAISSATATEGQPPRDLPRTYPKIFGVGIRARIFSNSSAVTRLMPFLRHESSTAFTTIPRTKAGIFFMRAAAASRGHARAGPGAVKCRG